MKRILFGVVAAGALALCGLFAGSADAHGPHGYGCRGYGGHGRYGYGAAYGGFLPYNVYSQRYAPYGAGYAGGWQPYPGPYHAQPRFGVYFGY